MNIFYATKVGLLAASLIYLLQGCSETIDARQLQKINGLSYKIGGSEPFNGVATNYSFRTESLSPCIGEMPFKKGLPDGKYECFMKNGTKVESVEFRNGMKNGLTQIWDGANGNIKAKIEWKNDQKDGVEERYNWSLNKLTCKFNWQNGKKVGAEQQWDPKGENLLIDLVWKDGQRTGTSKYDRFEITYKDGRIVSEKVYEYGNDINKVQDVKLEADRYCGSYFAPAIAPSSVSQERTYDNGNLVSAIGAQENSSPLANSQGLEKCVESKIAGFRKERGETEPITHDMLSEMESSCGK